MIHFLKSKHLLFQKGFPAWILFAVFLGSSFMLQAQTITGPTEVCVGDEETYTFTGTIDPDLTYEWTITGGAPKVSTNQAITVVWQVGGTGTVELSECDASGNCNEFSLTGITVSDLGTPEIWGSFEPQGDEDGTCNNFTCTAAKLDGFAFGCSNQTLNYFATPIPMATYTWTITEGTILSGQGTSTVEIGWEDVGSVLMTLQIELNGCEIELIYCVNVLESPQAVIGSVPEVVDGLITVCPGQQVLFMNESVNGESTFWDFGDENFSSEQNPVHVYEVSGTYEVSLSASSECGCANETFVTVQVLETDAPHIEPLSTLCPAKGRRFEYAVTNTMGCEGAMYTWEILHDPDNSGPDGYIVEPSSFPSSSPEVEVVWGFPENGVGVLCVTVENCGEVCEFQSCISINVTNPSINLEGPTTVCAGETAVYTVPPMPGSTYDWSVMNGGIVGPSNSNEITVIWTNNAPATGVVELEEAINSTLGCARVFDALQVDILPNMNISGPIEYCEGGSFSYSVPGNADPVDWVLIDENQTPVDAVTAVTFQTSAALTPGSYTLEASSDNYCNEATLPITIVAQAPAPILANPDPVCPNSTHNYTIQTDPEFYVVWTAINGTIAGSGIGDEISVTWGSNGPYSLTLVQHYLEANCPSDPVTVEVPVAPDEELVITGPTLILGECTVTYTAPVSSANQVWSISPTNIASIVDGQGTSEITVSVHQIPGGVGNFTVSLTADNCGEEETAILEVSIITLTPPTIDGPTEVCLGEEVEYTAIHNESYPVANVSWNFGNGMTSGIFSPVNSGAYNSEGVQTVSLTVEYDIPGIACGSTVAAEHLIEVRRLPVAEIVSPTGTVLCIGQAQPVRLEAITQTPPTTTAMLSYEWIGPGGGAVGTGPVLDNILTPGLYTLIVTMTDGDLVCTSTDQVSVVEQLCPESCSDFEITSGFRCNNYRFQVVTEPGVAFQVVWNFGDGTIMGPISTDILVAHTYESPGYYTVSADVLGQPCDPAIQVVVPLIPDFTAEVSCNSGGDGYVIDFVSYSEFLPNTEPTLYEFYYGVGNFFHSSTEPISSVSTNGLPSGNLEITMVAHSGYDDRTCQSTTTVFIPELPIAGFDVEDPSCEGTPLEFINTSVGNIVGASWDFGDGSGSGMTGNVDKTYEGFTADPYQPIVTLTVFDGFGCSDTYSQELSINQNSLSGEIEVNGTLPACANQGVALGVNATSDAPPITYTWFKEGEDDPIATGSSITVFEAGVYSVLIEDQENCALVLESDYINLIPTPTPIIEGIGMPCLGDELDLTTNYPFPAFTIEWVTTYPPGGPDPDMSSTPELTVIGDYTISVTVTDNVSGCVGTALTSFTVNPPPNLTIESLEDPACTPLTLGAIANCEGGCQYQWSNNATEEFINVIEGGTYSVTVTDGNGCTADESINVEEIPSFENLMTGSYVFCPGDNAPVWIVPLVAGYQYDWFRLGDPSPIGSGNVFDFTPHGSGIYFLVITTSFGCEYTSDLISIDILDDCDNTTCNLSSELISVECIASGEDVYELVVSFNNQGNNLVGLAGHSDQVTVSNLTTDPSVLPGGAMTEVSLQISDPTTTDVCVTFTGWDVVQNAFCETEVCFTIAPCDDPCEEVNWSVNSVTCFNFFGIHFYIISLEGFSPAVGITSLDLAGVDGPLLPFSFAPDEMPPGQSTTFGIFGIGSPGNVNLTISGGVKDTEIECSWEVALTLPDCPPLFPVDCMDEIQLLSHTTQCIGQDRNGNYLYTYEMQFSGLDRRPAAYLLPGQSQTENTFQSMDIDLGRGTISGIMVDAPPFDNSLCFSLLVGEEAEGQYCSYDFCVSPQQSCHDGGGETRFSNALTPQPHADLEFEVYPNPAKNEARLSWNATTVEGELTLQLEGLTGQRLQQYNLDAEASSFQIPLEQFAPGLYFVSLRKDGVLLDARRLIIVR